MDKKTKLEEVKKEAVKAGLRDFYNYARNYYLKRNSFAIAAIPLNKIKRLHNLAGKAASLLGIKKEHLWEREEFHIAFKVSNIKDLASLGIKGVDLAKVQSSMDNGRGISILPINALLGSPTIKKFIPTLPKLFSGEKRHSLDPYGIFRGQDQIKAMIAISKKDAEKLNTQEVAKQGRKVYKIVYLGSRKFDYAVLVNITEFCSVGCAECYKGVLTRMSMAALSDIDPEYAALKKQLILQEERARGQVKLLRKWLDKHPEVNTAIISGGEPLMYSYQTIKAILNELGKAKHLKVVRICTSSVYQGLFFKISDKLVEILKEFKRKKQLYFNCHMADEHQILTPEARMVTKKLQEAGVSIHLQMPLQEGINFYRNNLKKSAEKMKKICEAAYEIGVIPYKAIVNMHSPSYKELTVPIEKVSETISFLDGHFDTSDMARWQAYNILHEQGNAYIYAKPNLAAAKEIDRKRKRVTYYLPKAEPTGEISVHTYEEPLLEGLNDKNSLLKINDKKISSKIAEVKKAYYKLRKGKIDTRKFYRISGIRFSENEPLVVED